MHLHVRWLMLLSSARAWNVRALHPHSALQVWSSSCRLSDGKRSSAICRNIPETRWARLGSRRSTATHSNSAQGTALTIMLGACHTHVASLYRGCLCTIRRACDACPLCLLAIIGSCSALLLFSMLFSSVPFHSSFERVYTTW